ncbi:YceI family protein [Hugenholtzia roseola]|uniref:YceI family protein n=1 Tax=Hugenholtzia roseola TaxID=1002 RepID=UPI000416281C|nr:YceI family protein [Hugenholtzia roseola]
MIFKSVRLAIAAFFLAALVVACNSAPQSQEAETKEEVVVNTEEQKATAQEFAIDPQVSTVTWIGTKPTGQHDGTIGIKEGKIYVENNQVTGGKIVIDMNSIVVKDITDEKSNADLVGHLKGADFFNAEQYPTATFEIASVEPISGEVKLEGEHNTQNPTHKVTGNLTILDKTNSITFYANLSAAADGASGSAKFNIDRTNWGIVYKSEGDKSLGDKFIHNKINLGFEFKTQASATANAQ